MAKDIEGYQIKEEVFLSDRSVIYRAERDKDQLSVIIKVLNSEYPTNNEISRFKHEFQIAKKVGSEGVIKAFEEIRYGNSLALVFDDFHGESFQNYLEKERKMALDLFLKVAIDSCRSLGNIHKKDVIHKDINSRNLLINTNSGKVQIIDFGISTELSREKQNIDVAHQLEGSLAYISPEQTGRMNRDLDYRSDYYSLGVTFYELLTGTLPFSADDTIGWVHAHIAKTASTPKELDDSIPSQVSDIIMKLLAKDPDDRYQSTSGIIYDLEECHKQFSKHGRIEPFDLGKVDFSEKFQIPQHLVGREIELDILIKAFESISDGGLEFLLVSGYSGVGKSALVHEIDKPIVQKNGHFIDGKYDQFQRDVPYSALVQAFRNLVNQLLTESDENLERWRSLMLEALQTNGKIITDLIPEVAMIIGEQEPVGELGPTESHNRFLFVFKRFVQVFSRKEHPLVVFLDDLQWADVPTLKLVEYLMKSKDLGYFFLIGAYRSNEVKEGHQLKISLEEIQKEIQIDSISLQPLAEEHIQQIVKETLHCDTEKSAPLAELIFKKTQGNPFFINSLLKTLYQEGIFNFSEGAWDWNIEDISKMEVSDNVVDFMIKGLKKLPEETQTLLQLSASIGNSFDLGTLSLIHEHSNTETARFLMPAIKEGIVVPLSDEYRLVHLQDEDKDETVLGVSYRFQHDRVQQAAYALLDDLKKEKLHYKIAHLIKSATPPDKIDDRLIEMVRHYNDGKGQIDTDEERIELCQLNLRAAKRAEKSTAYGPAFNYLKIAKDLLPDNPWETSYEVCASVFSEYAIIAYLNGEMEVADEMNSIVLSHAKTKEEKVSVYRMQVMQYSSTGRLEDGLDAGLNALAILGLKIPKKPIPPLIIKEVITAKMAAGKGMDRLLNAPAINDPRIKKIMRLLIELTLPSYMLGLENLMAMCLLKNVNLAMKHGSSPESAYAYSGYALLLRAMEDFKSSTDFGKLSIDLNEKINDLEFRCKINYFYGCFVYNWIADWRDAIPYYKTSMEAGFQAGDLIQSGFSWTFMVRFNPGLTVLEAHTQFKDVLAFMEENKQEDYVDAILIFRSFYGSMMGKTNSPTSMDSVELDEKACIRRVTERNSLTTMAHFYLVKLQLGYYFDEPEEGLKYLPELDKNIPALVGMLFSFECCIYIFLALAKTCTKENQKTKVKEIKRMKKEYKLMKKWHDYNSTNTVHLMKMMEAEFARIDGDYYKSIELLEGAVEYATKTNFYPFKAIANEMLGEIYLVIGKKHIADLYITDALYDYQMWGATRKIEMMQAKYDLASKSQASSTLQSATVVSGSTKSTQSTVAVDESSIDMATVSKAAQTLSSEVDLRKLLTKMMDIVRENAGAEKGILLLTDGPKKTLLVQAKSIGNEEVELLNYIPPEKDKDIALSVVKFVSRTMEDVVLGDASNEGDFTNDAYIAKDKPKSMLCLPILNQGNLVGILYLENNVASYAFTPDRIEVLSILSSQAAISIENALLYQNLEQKVQERTLQLSQKNKDIQSMLQNMHQGIFTILGEGVIHHEYSAWLETIFGTKNIAGVNAIDFLFNDSSIGSDSISLVKTMLISSMGESEIQFELNEDLLINEMIKTVIGQEKILELEWDPIMDDNNLVEKIMVVVKDVTEIRALQRETEKQKVEMDKISQILDVSVEKFREFLTATNEFLDENEKLIKGSTTKDLDLVAVIFRNMHTVKGNARTFKLSYLVDVIHEAEESYTKLKDDDSAEWDPSKLLEELALVRQEFFGYSNILETKLSSQGSMKDQRKVDLLESIYREATELTKQDSKDLSSFSKRIIEYYDNLEFSDMQTVLEPILSSIPEIASSLSKPAPEVEIVASDDIKIDESFGKLLQNVFTHCFRNSLDHGIESPEVRSQKGKSERGKITLKAELNGSEIRLILRDDGAGLNIDALYKKGIEKNIITSSASTSDIAGVIFSSGVSTASELTDLSGRGVGMDAVQAFLRKKGGDIQVHLEGEKKEDGFHDFHLVLSLPWSTEELTSKQLKLSA